MNEILDSNTLVRDCGVSGRGFLNPDELVRSKSGPRSLAILAFVAALALIGHAPLAPVEAKDFSVRASDGVEIFGEALATEPRPRVAVIFVAGTGLFDRDATLGITGTPRDKVFKDLAQRMLSRGVASVRHDARGVRYGMARDKAYDRTLLAGRTTSTMRDDLAAVYSWSRSRDGLNARCIVFFAHSEGMLHVARLFDIGAPAPTLVIGVGAPMESPMQVVRWQLTEREAHSLELMDVNRDGLVTNEEVRTNLFRTPAAVHGALEPFLHPEGAWKAEHIAALRTAQSADYGKMRLEWLAQADSDPYPNAVGAIASYQWWKSWFLDDRPTAELLARWPTPVSLHYGDKDSQTPAALQIAAASKLLAAARLKVRVHADRGHTLGEHVFLGPINSTIADQLADEAAAVLPACS